MILIAGTVDLDPDQRDAALAATCELMAETRTQHGCLDYVWAPDSAVPGRIYVFERWRDRDALAAHFEGPYYRKMLAAMSSHGIRGVDVSKYRIDAAEPVYGADGRPSADFDSEERAR